MAELRERIALRFKRHCTCCDGWPEGETCATCREEAGVVIGLAAKWLRDWSGRIVDGGNGASAVVAKLADEMEAKG